jgi:ABC-type multidrug transport system ATPase subunit
MALLEVKNLCFKLASDKVLFDNLAFEVMPSSGLLVYGPNGSGKTTLVKILLGLKKNFRGEIEILGRSLNKLSESQKAAQRSEIGFMMQEPVVLDDLNLVENMLLYLRIDKKKLLRRDILKTLYKHGFSGSQKKKISELSWGQIRMLEMIRIILKSPRLVICDQPFAALDKVSMVNLAEKLNTLVRSGCGVVVTYSLPEVREYLEWPEIRLAE